MILEVAILHVIPGRGQDFEQDFQKASLIIASMKGYLSHELQKCIAHPSQYLLLVKWETLADHIEGFRGSEEYQEWKALLHHYYDPFPIVEHYEVVM